MIRTIGILCGSAVAIAFLIVALGIPEFLPAEPVAIEAAMPVAPLTHPEPPAADTVAPVTPVAATAVETVAEPVAEAATETFAETLAGAAEVSEPRAENWFAFWSPFRSEIAANGFITQLQRETGMDYRVVKVKPGVYEVAFSYDGEDDIETHLATISRATGLEMPDG